MTNQSANTGKALGAIDFEAVDLDTARHALDSPPPGVEERKRLRPGYWEERRRPLTATDRALAGAALEWIVRLPPALRPRALAERYPRVVNLIAETWSTPQQWRGTFDELMFDSRGARQGFPHEIELELQSLRRYREGLMAE